MRFARLRDQGFSFVELLAYMAIAALLILAAVPQFSNYRSKAQVSNARSDLHNAASAMEGAYDPDRGYPAAIPASSRASTGITLRVGAATADTFCLTAETPVGQVLNYASAQGGQIGDGRCAPSAGSITSDGSSWADYEEMGFNPGRYGGDSDYSLIDITNGPEGATHAARTTWKTDQAQGRGFGLVGNTEVAQPSPGAPVTPGKSTTISLYARPSTNTMTAGIAVRFINASGAWTETFITSPDQRLVAGKWNPVTFSFTPPDDAVQLASIFTLRSGTVAPGDTLDVTGLVYAH